MVGARSTVVRAAELEVDMSRTIFVAVGVAAVAAACGPSASQNPIVQFPGTVMKQQHLTVTDRQVNMCSGEVVHLAGDVHLVVTEHDSTRDAHVNGQLTGTGSLGNDYILNLQIRADVPANGRAFDVLARELLISKGGAPNQLTTVTITSDPFSVSVAADCRG
jgi:hypothetical protein